MRIPASPNMCTVYNSYAKLLCLFVCNFKDIYGPNKVSYNVHDVAMYGTVDSFSIFQAESLMFQLKRATRALQPLHNR